MLQEIWDGKDPTGARQELLDLFVLRHVLDGSVDLLSDLFNGILPFHVTVTSIQEPVCRHKILYYRHLRIVMSLIYYSYLVDSNEKKPGILLKITFDCHGLLTQKLTGLYVDREILNILFK